MSDDLFRACVAQVEDEGDSDPFSRSRLTFEGLPIILDPVRYGDFSVEANW